MKRVFGIIVLLVMTVVAAYATTIRDSMRYEGPMTLANSKTFTINSGSKINFASGSSLQIAGVNMTTGANQLNYLASVTPGTAAVNKAVVLGAANAIDQLNITTLRLGSVTVTANATDINRISGATTNSTELNYLSGVTAGTAAVNKAVVLGAANAISQLNITSLMLGSSAVSANATEINRLSGVTAGTAKNSAALVLGTSRDTDYLAVSTLLVSGINISEASTMATSDSTITLGAGGANVQTATIQLKNSAGNVLAVQQVRVYMATDAAGANVSSTGCNNNVTLTTGGILKVQTAKLDWDIVTDANGTAVMAFNNIGAAGNYTDRVILVLPNKKVKVSSALSAANA